MPVRHDRRRRVLADELHKSIDTAEVLKVVPGGDDQRYAPPAHREGQPRLGDLVPRHPLSVCLAVGLALLAMVGTLTAAAFIDELAQFVPRPALTALQPEASHGVVAWLASLFFLANVVAAWLVYSLRKHRIDDYYGRYRIWLAVALASLLTSLHIGTGVGAVAAALLETLAQRCRMPAGWGPSVALVLAGGYLLVRLCFEVKRSRLALLTLMAAATLLCVPAASGLLERFNLAPEQLVLAKAACMLCGCWLVPTATLLFARHVLLDIEGKVPQRASKRRKSKTAATKLKRSRRTTDLPTTEAETTSTATSPKREDPPQKARPTFTPRSDLKLAGKAADIKPAVLSQPSDEEEEPDLSQLSRTERKRLKREAKLARRAEAA